VAVVWFDVTDPSAVDATAVTTPSETVYVSADHLYLASSPYRGGWESCCWDVPAPATAYAGDDGTTYLFFVRFTDGNCIWQVQLSGDFLTPLPGTLRKSIAVSAPWENIWPRVNEGPSLLLHQGTYYLTYSANSYESKDYAVGYATASHLADPWQKSSKNPILRRIEGLCGTGHHTFFIDRKGALRIAFHAHRSDTAIHPRAMYIATMEFTPEGYLQLSSAPIVRPKLLAQP
jgi:beta-xylosidase